MKCAYIVSDEPTSLQTFREYGEHFDIEEEFLDEKSNGFQLEKSLIRSPMALSRLCLVMAITTLFLTVQGQEVVKTGKRSFVDEPQTETRPCGRTFECHTFRGSTLSLCGDIDPSPAITSQKQAKKFLEREFRVRTFSHTW